MPSLPVSNLSEAPGERAAAHPRPRDGRPLVASRGRAERADRGGRARRRVASALVSSRDRRRGGDLRRLARARAARVAAGSVTLVDRYPPGHVRAASGGESRLIRSAHGADAWYVRSVRRACERWRGAGGGDRRVAARAVRRRLARPRRGRLGGRERARPRRGGRPDRAAGPDRSRRAVPELRRRRPRLLPARARGRRCCGRATRRGRSRRSRGEGRPLRRRRGAAAGTDGGVEVDGEQLDADVVVWACGAWLAGLFPDARASARHTAGGAPLRRADRLGDAARAGLGRLRRRVLRASATSTVAA